MSDDLKTRSRAWIKPVIFLAFFCVNVLAAYVPTPLFLREAATSTSPTTPKDVFFRVPVALAYIAVDTYMGPNPRVGFERFMQARRELLSIGRWLVVAFMLLLFVVSADWYNSKKAWVAMPSIVLAYSLLQALIAAVIEGLNALGGV
jgi:hypothetical protein